MLLTNSPIAELEQHLAHGALGGDVEGGGHLVGDEQRRVEQCRDDHHETLLHPTRELDGVSLENLCVETDELDAALQLGEGGLVVEVPRLQELGHHLADLACRIEGAHGVLRDDGHLGEAQRAHRLVVRDGQLLVVQLHAAAELSHPHVHADEAVAEGRLPAAGLAGEAHDLAVVDARS